MTITWKDTFFAGITDYDLIVNGRKRGTYSIEAKTRPTPDVISVFRFGPVKSEAEARKVVFERAIANEETTPEEKAALEVELNKLYK